MPIHISPRVSEPHRPRSMLVSKTSGVQHDLPRRSARKTSLFPVSTVNVPKTPASTGIFPPLCSTYQTLH
ncbi:hypothetical protein SCLCIDRAFT_563007 [Scleroderma citrinum Foug A]|uniref:Uncharacterized protein n=1 Tax=Scleroderma citrinum Foug A TaxID=1036808 RepID=A0A0C3DX41_9AGAM|nr:hypothetical protein SCLCIDRAFT_563007 [Scleroderma citrinum Foug A]